MKQLIGRKVGMTRLFGNDGSSYAVTFIEVLPNVVVQIKSKDKDGYDSFVVGYDVKKKNINNCEKGIAKKNNLSPFLFYREIFVDELVENISIGSELNASLFKSGEKVDVIGISKGKGYSGVIKRYHHKIGYKSHGSGYHRGQGSFANNGRCNNRVLPGKKMSGHHGFKKATILNLSILETNVEKKYILVNGAVPGAKKTLVKIRSSIKK